MITEAAAIVIRTAVTGNTKSEYPKKC